MWRSALVVAHLLLAPADPWTDDEICADGVSCEQLDEPSDDECTDVNGPDCDDAMGRSTAQSL